MQEQHNNHQQKDVLTICNEADKAVTNEDYKSVSGTPAQTGKKLPLAVEQFVPSRRTLITRLILRRRLHERYHQDCHGRRNYVNYSDISPLLIQATVAAEDHSFWQNNGVDLQGTIRAAVANLQHQTVIEGGSTITQQLVKNQLFLTDPRTIQIKSEEAILAYVLTQQYSKWQIMEMYLNTVYYGDLNYGVEATAHDYFNLQGKCTGRRCEPAVSHLDLAQATLLAGLPQSPSYYNPVINKSVAL